MKSEKSADMQQGRAISVWFLEEDIKRLKEIAREKGIGHTTLIRMWVREKLKELKHQRQTR